MNRTTILGGSTWRWCLLGLSLLLAPVAQAAKEEQWITVKSKFFTLITPAGEKVARKWARELELFRHGMQIANPVPEERLRPVTLLLFPDDRSMRPFTTLKKGDPVRLQGFFAHKLNVAAMVLGDASVAENRHTIYHEAAHWHASAADTTLPMWLAEGLAEVYADFKINEAGECVFGEMNQYRLRALGKRGFGGLKELVHAKTVPMGNRNQTYFYYAQLWAVAHYMMFSSGAGNGAMKRFNAEWRKSGDGDAAMKAAFGKDFGAVEEDIRDYLNKGKFRVYRIPLNVQQTERDLVTAPAEPGEVDLAIGMALLATRGTAPAAPYLLRAKEERPQDPRVFECLGVIAAKEEGPAEARIQFQQAIDLGSTADWVYTGVAEGCAKDRPDTAADLYLRAIRLNPGGRDAYEGLAGMIYTVSKVNIEQARAIARACARWPDSGRLQLGRALVALKAGDAEAARARLKQLLAGQTLSEADASYANRVLEAEEWNRQIAQIDELIAQSRYGDAVRLADEIAPGAPSPSARIQLARGRKQAFERQQLEEARETLRRGETQEARTQLAELAADAEESAVRSAANALLAELGSAGDADTK